MLTENFIINADCCVEEIYRKIGSEMIMMGCNGEFIRKNQSMTFHNPLKTRYSAAFEIAL